jgi:hypothetical protein
MFSKGRQINCWTPHFIELGKAHDGPIAVAADRLSVPVDPFRMSSNFLASRTCHYKLRRLEEQRSTLPINAKLGRLV